MGIYLFLIAVLAVCGYIEISGKYERAAKYTEWISFALFLFVGVFRETTVGNDALSYDTDYFSVANRWKWGSLLTDFSKDNGFMLLTKIIRVYTDDYWGYRAILFTLTLTLYFCAIRENSNYVSVSLFIFAGLSNLGLMLGILRQALAGAICFFSYGFLKREKEIPYALLVLLAATMHKTALICLLYLPLRWFVKKRFSPLIFVFGIWMSLLVGYSILPVAVKLYANGGYVNSMITDGGEKLFLAINVLIGSVMFFASDTVWHKGKFGNLLTPAKADEKYFYDTEHAFQFNVASSSVFVQTIAMVFWGLLTRMRTYLSIYWVLLLPEAIEKLPQKRKILFFIGLILAFGVMIYFSLNDVDYFVLHKFA